MAGVVDSFVKMIREIVGLPADPGAPPDIMRLGLYPARVDVCQSDGKHCDVTPADTRVSTGEKNVEILTGIPGATATVEPGAIVLLGWRRGDPGSPYCMPAWAIGAVVDKLILNANALELAGNAHPLPLFDTFQSDMNALIAVIAVIIGSSTATGPLLGLAAAYAGPPHVPPFVTNADALAGLAASLAVTASYQSTKVKNG